MLVYFNGCRLLGPDLKELTGFSGSLSTLIESYPHTALEYVDNLYFFGSG